MIKVVIKTDLFVHLAETDMTGAFIVDKENHAAFLVCNEMQSVQSVRVTDNALTCLECIARSQ